MEISENLVQTEAHAEPNPWVIGMPLSDDQRQRMVEARKAAVSKRVYGSAIQTHCEECFGVNPAATDCEAGTSHCQLYHLNTREKRRKSTKTAIRKAIRRECIKCVGTRDDICTSPNCKLHPFRLCKKPELPKKEEMS